MQVLSDLMCLEHHFSVLSKTDTNTEVKVETDCQSEMRNVLVW